jgi:thiol-disulfide isomerase/thioredoxin
VSDELPTQPDRPDGPQEDDPSLGSAASATGPSTDRPRSSSAIWIGLALVVVLLAVAAVALTSSGDEPTSQATTAPSGSGGDAVATIDGPARTEPISDGSPIPAWSAPTLDGGRFEWAGRPEGPTVLAIWAPWCPHCQAELPRLSAAVERHPGISLVTLASALNQPGPTPQDYMDSEGLSFTVGLDDEASTVAAGLGIQGFPTTYFVDAAGLVIVSASGELDPDALEEVLTALEGG